MRVINNTYVYHPDFTEILVTKSYNPEYLEKVLIDTEDLPKVGRIRVSDRGYVYVCGSGNKAVAHIVMGHRSNMDTVVDHINNDRRDNRKKNLRVLSQADNANNRGKTKSNIGIPGIALRAKGNYRYYRATIFDRKVPVNSGKTKAAAKRYCKQFNINKLGDVEAIEQAKRWLLEKRKEYGYVL